MGRPLRIDAPGTWHHVMNRGAGRRIVFRTDGERLTFLGLVAQVEERFEVEVHCYCLMGNHYHLLVRSSTGRLSEAMGWVGSNFTRRVNAERDVDGAIFRGRFHSVLITRESHLDWLFGYVNANPKDLGWTAEFADYPWSGLGATVGLRAPEPWLRTDYVRSRFGEDPNDLSAFVEGARKGEIVPKVISANDSDVATVVQLARAPGPAINTDAEVRAAHTFLMTRTCAEASAISTIADLDVSAQRQYVARVERRISTDPVLQGLVARASTILDVSAERRHRVPGTQ